MCIHCDRTRRRLHRREQRPRDQRREIRDRAECSAPNSALLQPGERVIRMPPRENPGPLVSDAEREAVVQQLQAAFIDGRLTADEFEERQDAAYAARRQPALDATLEGLPKQQPLPPPRDWASTWIHAWNACVCLVLIIAWVLIIGYFTGGLARNLFGGLL